MRQQQSRLDALGVRVVVITFEDARRVAAYVRETAFGWPVLIDRSRALYQAYGMDRGGVWPIWGPPAWWIYIKLLARGRRLHRITGDVHQLGGDVLIDPEGAVRYHHVGRGPADRPLVEDLLGARGGTL